MCAIFIRLLLDVRISFRKQLLLAHFANTFLHKPHPLNRPKTPPKHPKISNISAFLQHKQISGWRGFPTNSLFHANCTFSLPQRGLANSPSPALNSCFAGYRLWGNGNVRIVKYIAFLRKSCIHTHNANKHGGEQALLPRGSLFLIYFSLAPEVFTPFSRIQIAFLCFSHSVGVHGAFLRNPFGIKILLIRTLATENSRSDIYRKRTKTIFCF